MAQIAHRPQAGATTGSRPPRSLNVVRDPAPGEVGARIDWTTWYLTDEEDMGESCEQGIIMRVLLSVLAQLLHERGWTDRFWVGADNSFGWVPDEPNVRVSPDVYVLSPPPALPLPKCWETWRPGHRPPTLAMEIVSDDWRKDYEQGPQEYAQLGADELVIFDPDAARGATRLPERIPLQVYVREADGSFVRASCGEGPVWSRVLGAWLTVVDGTEAPLVRLVGEDGRTLVPTEAEAREAERAAREAEGAAREAAEHKLAALEAEFERLRQEGAR